MATSVALPLSCVGCINSSKRISELEGRISILHQIREDEQLLDSMLEAASIHKPAANVANDASAKNITHRELDDEQTRIWDGKATHSTSSAMLQDQWPVLGAKPKALICSTPIQVHANAWSKVPVRNSKRCSTPPPGEEILQLSNRFQALDLEGLSLPECPTSLLPDPPAASHRPGSPLRPRAGASTLRPPPPPRPSAAASLQRSPRLSVSQRRVPGGPQQRERPTSPSTVPPSVLVVGSSMVRHVAIPKAETCCYPGAKVLDINTTIKPLLSEYPSATTVVVHVGANDIKNQESEQLKTDFRSLINTLLDTGRTCIVSGPFSSPRYWDMKFSRIRNLHVWLKGYCCSLGITFVDNFTTLSDRNELFAPDGLHPNRTGSLLLARNMILALKSCLFCP